MKEVLRTLDIVKQSWVLALLSEQDIEGIVLDTHASIVEGSAFAIQRRVMVVDDDYPRAIHILQEAGVLDRC